MAYAGTVRGTYGMVQLHTSGRYNIRQDFTKSDRYKIGTVQDFSLWRNAWCSLSCVWVMCFICILLPTVYMFWSRCVFLTPGMRCVKLITISDFCKPAKRACFSLHILQDFSSNEAELIFLHELCQNQDIIYICSWMIQVHVEIVEVLYFPMMCYFSFFIYHTYKVI